MVEPVIIGNATLYQGDCMDILPTLGKVDAVVTDPPYIISSGYGGGAFGDREYLDGIEQAAINTGFDLNIFSGVQNLVAFCSKDQISEYIEYAISNKLKWDLLAWHKPNPTPLCFERYLPDIEFIFHLRAKGVAVKGEYQNKSRVIIHPAQASAYDHPTVKPVGVVNPLILSASGSGDVIADPFMGSGTTGVACMNLGRKFIGIELEPKYFDIACERIAAAQAQGRLFE
jgi:DNA modification methylase